MQRGFLRKNPSVFVFLAVLAVFTLAVTVMSEGFGMGLVSTSFVKTLGKTLTPTAREQLAALVRKFIQNTGEADIKTWINAVEMTACRTGFLLCNDIQSAARMIQNQAAAVGDVPAKEKIKELVIFSVSEEYFRLREALGIAIAT